MQQTIFKPVSIPCTSFYLIILSGRIQKSIRGEAADGCSPGVLAWECRGTVGVGLCGEDWERDCHGGTGMDRGIFGEGGDSPWNWIKQKKPPHFCSEGVPFVKSKIKCLFWVFYCRNGKYFYRLKRLKTLKYKENHAITRIAWLSCRTTVDFWTPAQKCHVQIGILRSFLTFLKLFWWVLSRTVNWSHEKPLCETLIFPLASRSYPRLPLPKGQSRPD